MTTVINIRKLILTEVNAHTDLPWVSLVKILAEIFVDLGCEQYTEGAQIVWNEWLNQHPADEGWTNHKLTLLGFFLAMSRKDLVEFFQTFTTVPLK